MHSTVRTPCTACIYVQYSIDHHEETTAQETKSSLRMECSTKSPPGINETGKSFVFSIFI